MAHAMASFMRQPPDSSFTIPLPICSSEKPTSFMVDVARSNDTSALREKGTHTVSRQPCDPRVSNRLCCRLETLAPLPSQNAVRVDLWPLDPPGLSGVSLVLSRVGWEGAHLLRAKSMTLWLT